MSSDKLQQLPYPIKPEYVLRSIAVGITASTTETQAGATQLSAEINVIETATATDAVVLLPLQPGQCQIIKNATAAAVTVFPAADQSIDGGTVDAEDTVDLGAGDTRMYVGAPDGVDVISIILNTAAHVNAG